MRFEPYTDGIFFGVRETDAEPDGADVFSTFREAKAEAVRRLEQRAREFRISAREARRMKRADVERATPSG
jgi:hypothetical protein